MTPAAFRAALAAVPAFDRDVWLDRVLGLDDIAPDDASLPRGCVPHLPSPIDKLLEVAVHANVRPGDVVIDIGSGAGRASVAMHLLSGATVIGLEIQPSLVRAARELSARMSVEAMVAVVEGDAAITVAQISTGSVFFLYCPFGGERLAKVLSHVEAIARTRPVRVCCLDMPELDGPWLELTSRPSAGLDIYCSATPVTSRTFRPVT